MASEQPRRILPLRLSTRARIDRGKRIYFEFDGRSYFGYAGDTLASALLASGESIFGRSFKYHRKRGVFATGEEEPNALVQLLEENVDDGRLVLSEPNLTSTQVLLRSGLRARSQNRFPSLKFDLGAVAGFFSPLLVAGFYYKTFMYPSRAWRFYEYFIRRAAGLGRAPRSLGLPPRIADSVRRVGRKPFYEWMQAYPDVLIVGGGLAGLEAAEVLSSVSDGSLRVMLVEQDSDFGGSLLHSDPDVKVDGLAASAGIAARVSRLRTRENLHLLSHSCVSGYYDGNFLTAFEHVMGSYEDNRLPRQRMWRIRAKHVLLATGASERHAVFRNNDLPGIMLADSIRAYIRRYEVLLGRTAVIFTNNDNGYRSALALHEAGARVEIVDWRKDSGVRSEIVMCARKAGIVIYSNSGVFEALSSNGELSGVRIAERMSARAEAEGEDSFRIELDSSKVRTLTCSLLGVSGGFVPRVHLFSQAGGKLVFDSASNCYVADVQAASKSRLSSNTFACRLAGSLSGAHDYASALEQGRAAALDIANHLSKHLRPSGRPSGIGRGGARADTNIISSCEEMASAPSEPLPASLVLGASSSMVDGKANGISNTGLSAGRGKFCFLDLQNDSTEADVRLAIREGYRSLEHVKRYTTTGMATDQGKTSNMNAISVASAALETPMAELGTTTYRPPYSPQSFGAFVGAHCGELFHPVRTTPMHAAHISAGAYFEDVGDWKRPWFYPQGKRHGLETLSEACARESYGVRNSVGLFDGSTLGKIDIRGPDALWLLNMLYTNSFDNLKIGQCRYAIMLTEAGMIFDDGVTARVGKDHYYMTTTTGGAARVLSWIEEWLQTEWPTRKVYATSVSEQWAVCVVGGPRARALLAELCEDDISASALPFMRFMDTKICNISARIFRVSFSGESAFEINIPARYGESLWHLLCERGVDFDLVKYGTEAVHLLRAEKGFLIPGQDTDGTVTPYDANMGWIVDKGKEDFFGKRSLACAGLTSAGRKQLVGLLTTDSSFTLPEGTQLLESPKVSKFRRKPYTKSIGWVSSSYYSPNLEKSIALALVEDGLRRKGDTIYALTDRGCEAVKIVSSVFFDAKGERMRA